MTLSARTTCPFCLNGCELEVRFNYQFRMEYPADGKINQGRLCARGNSASIVIDHPRRLAYPLLDGKEITWEAALGKIRGWLSEVRPEEIGIVYSRGMSEQEIGMVQTWAESFGGANLVCGYIEPDNFLGEELAGARRATLEDLAQAKRMLIVGDAFGKSPVAAKHIVEARYRDRASRLVVIDSIKTRLAGFAHLFIWVRPGTEPWALGAIAGLIDRSLKGIDVERFARVCGVESGQFQEAAKIVSGSEPGVVISALCLGHSTQPELHSLLSQLVALKAGKPFAGFGEARLPEGRLPFGRFREAVAQGRIRLVFWFGGLHPYSYPEIFPEMKIVTYRVATSIFRPDEPLPGLVLPVPSELEKDSTGFSLWGEVRRQPVAKPVSGSRFVEQIVRELGGKAEGGMWKAEGGGRKVEEVVAALAAAPEPSDSSGDGFLLLGEKRAIGIGGFFETEQEISIHPDDAARVGVREADGVVVKSPVGERVFQVHVTPTVPAGVVAVGVNCHANRALFPIATLEPSGRAVIPPVKVQVWRKG
ncbi:MAG: molybdopterin dinucleotide binding domain-containing protein [candidate division WOR-3 bacterium]